MVLAYLVNQVNTPLMLKKQKAYPVKGSSEILSGRDEGKTLAQVVLNHLEELEPDSILPLDLSDVKFIDFSCADEFLTKIIRRIISGELGTRFILLQGMSVNVEENFSAVFKIRELVCPKTSKGGKVELLGRVGAELAETYMLAAKKGKITASDVRAIAPRVGLSAISNRLTRLYKMRLLMRVKEVGVETGGRQFVYVPVG